MNVNTFSVFFIYVFVTICTDGEGLLNITLKHSNDDLYNMIQKMNQSFAHLQNENSKLKQQLATVIQDNNDLHNEIQQINQSVALQPVAFEARLSHEISTLGDGQTIEYDQVVTNIGNGYDSRYGHFTAPVNGVYLFAVSAMAEPNESLELAIVKNGATIGYARSGLMTSDYESGTTIMPVSLVAGRYDMGQTFVFNIKENSWI